MRYRNTLFVCLVFCLGAFKGNTQQYQFQNFSVSDGLSQSQVYCLLEDSRGYIWMGTRGGGLSRWDGESFDSFTTKDGLPSNYLWAAAEDRLGALWFGTDNGLVRFFQNEFQRIPISDQVECSVTSLLAREETLFVGTNQGAYALNISNFEASMLPLDYVGLISVIALNGTEVWFGSAIGIHVYDKNQVKRIGAEQGLTQPIVRSLHLDDKDGMWVGTYGGGVFYWKDGALDNVNDWFPLKETRIHSIWSDQESIWFATQQKGLCRFNRKDSIAQFIDENHGLANNNVRSLLSDSWGNLWIGTSGGGVSKYIGQQFDYFTTENGLAGNYIYDISSDCVGDVWVATSGGLNRINEYGLSDFELPNALSRSKVRSFLWSSDSTLWIGTDGQGLMNIDTDTVMVFTTANGLGSNYIRDIVEDGYGNIWVASSGGGIAKLQWDLSQNRWKANIIGAKQGLTSSRINSLLIDKRNRIWFASGSNGIGYLQGDTVARTWTTAEGLSDNDVLALEEDGLGNLWIGTAKSGLNRMSISDDRFVLMDYNTQHGLSSDICYQLVMDEARQLWVGSEKGIQRLTLDEAGHVIESKLFGYEEGFQGVETTLNGAYRDDGGRLWFGTINGLSMYSGKTVEERISYPKLNFTDVLINTLSVNRSKFHELPYDSNMLVFRFKAVSQSKSGDIRYQWRLVGLDNAWTEASKSNEVTYSSLDKGQYQFELRSSIDQLHWTDPLTFHFSIKPPYWETLWFIALLVGGFLLFIGLFVGLRIKAIKQKSAEKEQQLILEKEVLALEQKALRLQMNPHFIFNALNSIQAMISSNDPKTARYFLAKFSKLMRQVLDNSRQKEIPLEREVESLTNYLDIEKFCYNNRFEYIIEMDEELDAESILIPPILIQPFVENAIIHGVSQLEGGGMVSVRFHREADFLICKIEDNGRGRDVAAKRMSQTDQKHKSTALLITQERLDHLNGLKHGQSITILDLKDVHGNAEGTKVIVRVSI